MRIPLQYKFFAILFFTSCITAAAMYLYVQWGFDKGYIAYLNDEDKGKTENIIKNLTQLYKQHESWDFMIGNHRLWVKISTDENGSFSPGKDFDALKTEEEKKQLLDNLKKIAPPPIIVLGPRLSLLDENKQKIIGGRPIRSSEKVDYYPIMVDQKEVGFLGLILIGDVSNLGELHFFKKQQEGLLSLGLAMAVLSLMITIPAVNYFLRPVVSLMKGTANLKKGQLNYRVPRSSSDELGDLVDDFNGLAMTLERNTEMKQRLFADISHELRTPLAILRGKIEAMIDGVRKNDINALESLQKETKRIEGLINNLYEVSMAEIGAIKYKIVEVDPASLLEETIDLYETRFQQVGIRIKENFSSEEISPILADPDRLQQVFVNLLQNTLRYTDAPGQLTISMIATADWLEIIFEDTVPGVPETSLDKIFDHLYRVDESRNRAKGGSGLGLAICKNIIEAHKGKIWAEPSKKCGLKIVCCLPLKA